MIIVLTGATGTGKSQMAIELAKQIDGEIINGDAFQVYQELSIATAKPSPEMLAEVPHHLFDFVSLTQNYDVQSYQRDARSAIEEVLKRKKTPIIAGGAGLYIRAALYDYDFVDVPPTNPKEYDLLDDAALYDELQKVDPEEAEKIHPHNRVRVMRALDIFLRSGAKKSDLVSKQKHEPIFSTRFYCLKQEHEELYPNVEKRVDSMIEKGLVEEVRFLTNKYGRTPNAFHAIGVKELYPFFDDKISLSDAVGVIKENTRHYIKRQETFFRHQFFAKDITSLTEITGDLQ